VNVIEIGSLYILEYKELEAAQNSRSENVPAELGTANVRLH
jgi:hypothetical protein